VLLQRAFTLIVLLIGVGLGLLLPRPWAEVEEAEAARKATVRCVTVNGGSIAVHNASDRDAAFDYRVFLEDGSPGAAGSVPLLPRQSHGVNVTAGTIYVTSAAPILVDAQTLAAAGEYRQAACFKGP
jgi:hypothetical protein